MNSDRTNKAAILVIGFLALVFIEAVFFSNGNIIFLLLGGIFFYYGFQKREKWTVIIAIIFIFLALMNLWSLRLLLLAAVFYIAVKLWKGTPSSEIFKPLRKTGGESAGIWKNRLFSIQSTPFSTYEWEDVHMQGFFGNIKVDVTDTVLPKGASFISIRQSVGKITIELPYDIPVRIHYATLYGEAKLLGDPSRRLLNESIEKKDGYETKRPGDPELIISLFTWIGDVEVRRK